MLAYRMNGDSSVVKDDFLANIRNKLESLAASLICTKCYDIVLDPQSFSDCCHFFCRKCLSLPVEACPTCQIPVNWSKDIHRDDRMAAIVQEYNGLLDLLQFKDPKK